MNFEQQIESNCGKLSRNRVNIVPFNRLEVPTLTQAVVFVFATWSGVSIISFRLLCQALAKRPESKLAIIVMDADGFNFDLFRSTFGELPQGKGEAFWIRNGQVVYRDHGYNNDTNEQLEARLTEFCS